MVQTEDGRVVIDSISEEGRIVLDCTILEDGRTILAAEGGKYGSDTGSGVDAETVTKVINIIQSADVGAGAEGEDVVKPSSDYEDFTTFTEVDIGADRIQKTEYHIDHYGCLNETTYLYKDYGAAHFSDFTHEIKAKQVTSTLHISEGIVWMLSNDLGNAKALEDANKSFIYVSFYRSITDIRIRLREVYNGTNYTDEYTTDSGTNWRYIQIEKSGTDLKVYIYSDSSYSTLLDTLTLTLHEDGSYRYLFGCNTYNSGLSGRCMTMDIENFDLSGGFKAKTGSDAGSGVDVKSSLLVVIEDSDYGSGVEAIGQFYKELIQSDAGVGMDALLESLSSRLHSDTGVGVDALINILKAIAETSSDTGIGVDALYDQAAALIHAETGIGIDTETIQKIIDILSSADEGVGTEAIASTLKAIEQYDVGSGIEDVGSRCLGSSDVGVGADALKTLGEAINIELPYTAKLGGVSLWIPKLSSQNFTITYEENDIPRFSFTLQNCDVNRTAIINHLTDDFIIYRGTTPILSGVIDCDQIEYVSIDQIKVGGFSKWIELGYLMYKRMADADEESADAVFIRDHPSTWTDRTTAAGNDTTNDVTVTFNGAGDGIYIGDNDRFNAIKVKYSTKGIQTGTPTFNVQYSKGSDVWATLDCVDESREFTKDPGAYFIFMPTLPPDWSKDTVNSSSKYWIRIVIATGSYSINPKLDRIWISQTDVCRVQFDSTAANTIMDLVLADTGYSVDGSDQCPSTIIPSIRGEYDSTLRWVAGIINALKWEDGNGDAQPYAWWIDASKKVHVKQVRGSAYGDITAKLTVLGNRLNYFEIANRIFGLGGGTGINQYHAIVENRSAQDTLGEIRETTFNDSRIFDHTLLKGQSGKLLTQSKTAKAQVKCSMPTYNWFEEGYEIGDRIKLHQPKWGIPDLTEYAIRRVDISLDTVNFDVGIGREHLDNLQGNIQQQMNIQDVYMQGETSTFQVGPVEANYQRVNDTTVYPVKMVIEIPSNTTAINKALISWKLGPYRASTTGTGTGGGHAHAPATPNTGLAGGHAHGDWVGLGGSGTPTGLGHTHKHQVNDSLTIDFGELYINSASNCGDNKSTVYGGNHHHTNPTTSLQTQGHTHSLPDYTGAYDDDDEWVADDLNTGSDCVSGSCITGIVSVAVPSTTHWHHLGGSTGNISQSHNHTQYDTGDTTPPNMYIEIDTTSVVFTVYPYVLGVLSQDEDPVHGLTIDTVSDHNNHGIDTLADFTHTVPGTDTKPDFDLELQYGIHEEPGGTVMQLFVGGEAVGTYDGDATDVNIRGYLSNGNNNVILQPIVTENHKGSAQLDAKIKVFIDTE